MDTPDAAEFDRWYAVVAGSARWQELVAVQLGLPDGFVATGFLSGNGLEEIGERLDLVEDDTLVDLGCGRAGYRLALVHHTGARLIGVDFSAVALAGAAEDAAARGLSDRTHFHVADLTATGLPAGTASAVVCVDALQFARSAPEALTECRRILQPGGGSPSRPGQPMPIR